MTLTSLSFICSLLAAVVTASVVLKGHGGNLLGSLGSLGSKGPGLGLISELIKLVPGGKSPDPLGLFKALLPEVKKLIK